MNIPKVEKMAERMGCTFEIVRKPGSDITTVRLKHKSGLYTDSDSIFGSEFRESRIMNSKNALLIRFETMRSL
jgi:uncharacterized protein YPO0396